MRAIDVNEHLITELATGQEEQITRLTYRDTFLRLSDLGAYPEAFAASICQSAGLRNILVHDYNDVDHRILHASIRTCLRNYHGMLFTLGRIPRSDAMRFEMKATIGEESRSQELANGAIG
ncbi:MAG: DUF86 domain-containing protein [Gammaproteobacteria bacterium]